jgi:aldose 1-epimerase
VARYGLLLLAFAALQAQAGIDVRQWGAMNDGRAVDKVVLQNERGMRVAYTDYGATIVAIDVPDRRGTTANVMLGLPTLDAYLATRRRHGAVIGRYAGRIGKARFPLDGRMVQLPADPKGSTVHGGPEGFDKRLWARRDFADSASIGSVYRLVSPDGDQGFPGSLDVRVTYRLMRSSNELRIEYSARTDAPTVVNLTNHGFFNLAGAGNRGLGTHRFRINASRYAVTNAIRVPTGELATVAGTPLDFRRPAGIMDRLAAASPLLGEPAWFDHGLVFDKKKGELALVAVVDEPVSGRMGIRTTEPAVVFNSGNGFDGSETGSEGVAYQRHDGFAFETQHLADSPNQPAFPSTVLRPGQVYSSVTSFRFSTSARR